jgi:limonene-1,2-epoxide hydrolase
VARPAGLGVHPPRRLVERGPATETQGAPLNAFRAAVEADDLEAVAALLADDVRFTSPVAFRPYQGKPITAAILRAVSEVFQDFRYVREIADGNDVALVFEASVDGRRLTGCDFLHLDDAGLVDDLMVMVRPLSGATALAAAMGARFEQIAAEAQAADAP